MNDTRVLKFGGAALADGGAVRRALRIVLEHGGERPILVVSAHQGVTDLLEETARAAVHRAPDIERVRVRHRSLLAELGLDSELCDRYLALLCDVLDGVHRRGRLEDAELDLVLSLGERMSARIVALAFTRAGVPATPVDAYDLGFVTDSNHGRARPLEGIGAAVRAALREVQGTAVVTGFLAKDARGTLTTLGRDGSDLTASVIAEAVGASEIQFWKCVPGVLTADPELVPEARVIDRLSYAEAAEYALHGANVLHPASVAPALRGRVAVRVGDATRPDRPGTRFESAVARKGPVGVASRKALARVEVEVPAPERGAARAAELFAHLERMEWATPCLVSIAGERASIVMPAVPDLEVRLGPLGAVRVERDLACAALIGRPANDDGALGLRAWASLSSAGIEVVEAFLGAARTSQVFLLRPSELAGAVRVLHAHVDETPSDAVSDV